MLYDVTYFIEKFQAIPPELWTERNYTDPRNPDKKDCFGHCGVGKTHTDEGNALRQIIKSKFGKDVTAGINDDDQQYGYRETKLGNDESITTEMRMGQRTKDRIITVLEDIRDNK